MWLGMVHPNKTHVCFFVQESRSGFHIWPQQTVAVVFFGAGHLSCQTAQHDERGGFNQTKGEIITIFL